MRRFGAVVGVFALVVVVFAFWDGPPATAGDGADATIAVLQTKVAKQSTQIAYFKATVSALKTAVSAGGDEKSKPQVFEGTGNLDTQVVFGKGRYKAHGECSSGVVFVYVTNDANGTKDIPISKDLAGGSNDGELVIPETATYRLEVSCDGDYKVSFE